MHEEYKKWYSPNLSGDLELLVYGHSGYPVILFPTSMGRYYESKDFKMIDSIQWFIEEGKSKFIALTVLTNKAGIINLLTRHSGLRTIAGMIVLFWKRLFH